jgi:hypothetical protein
MMRLSYIIYYILSFVGYAMNRIIRLFRGKKYFERVQVKRALRSANKAIREVNWVKTQLPPPDKRARH